MLATDQNKDPATRRETSPYVGAAHDASSWTRCVVAFSRRQLCKEPSFTVRGCCLSTSQIVFTSRVGPFTPHFRALSAQCSRTDGVSRFALPSAHKHFTRSDAALEGATLLRNAPKARRLSRQIQSLLREVE